ncbi:Transcriptional Coactivator p15 (PC4) [Nakaseomyces glabratus]|nr:Transcriptional Coactivator p15 (PC4) [Nakaseomyces glabratus]
MSYYSRYRKKNNNNGGASQGNNGGNLNLAAGLGQPDAIFDLGKNKRVTVRQFRNINLIDIREYYMDNATGEMRPGKKGISLTEDLYDEFLRHRLNIDDALRRLGSKRPRTKTVRLLSDDEDEEADEKPISSSSEKQEAIRENKDKDSNKNSASTNSKKHKKEGEEVEEPKKKQKKPAPPTLLPHEEKIRNLELEANATIIVPSKGKVTPPPTSDAQYQPQLPPLATVSDAPAHTESTTGKADIANLVDHDDNSTDEEFAKTLEAEMNRADDDESEEE